MPIDLTCPQCGDRLRVPDGTAGKKAKCPQCQAIFAVPASGAGAAPEPRRAEPVSAGEMPSPTTAGPVASAGAGMWRMKTPGGQTYGPIAKSELDGWVNEARVTGDCQVLLEGAAEWQWARDVYPQLGSIGAATPSSDNPFVSPTISTSSTSSRSRRHQAPHRGGLILTFGILGFLVCAIFGPIAWVMGSADMKQMRAGRMDRSGEGLTQAGMVCGIICTVLNGLAILFVLFFVCAAGAAGA